MTEDFVRGDLKDFARYGKLDAYELTDEEVAHLLDVWRWSVWTSHGEPADDVREACYQLQRHLARNYNVEVEYNTAHLLKQEIESLIYLRALLNAPKALWYFVRRFGAFIRALLWIQRYRRVKPVRDHSGALLGFPRNALCQRRAPDLLKRPYWRQLSPYTFEQRKRMDYWW